MSQHFLEQLDRVKARLDFRRRVVGWCWVFGITVVVALVLVAVDRGLGLHDFSGRLLATGILAAAVAWAVRRWMVRPGKQKPTRLNVALEQERRHPRLRGLLASAAQFAEQSPDDPLAGSLPLRRAVVLHAAQEAEDLDWEGIVPRRPLRRATTFAAVAAMLMGVFVFFAPQTASTGLARLALPLAEVDWPRKHHLSFVDPPTQLAEGSDFELHLLDRNGRLPESVEIQFRTLPEGGIADSGSWQTTTEEVACSGSSITLRHAAGHRRFQIRATGGDDHWMPWHTVDVLPRPRIGMLAVKAHPPEYTRLPVETLRPPYQVLEGSRLEIVGQVDQPLRAARLVNQQEIVASANIDDSGLEFHLDPSDSDSCNPQDGPWIADRSGRFQVELETRAGIVTRSPKQIALDVVPDRVPRVTWSSPRGSLSVLADATVETVVSATDDLAIQSISLVCRTAAPVQEGMNPVSDEVPSRIVSIYHRQQPPRQAVKGAVDHREVKYLLDLTDFSLKQGNLLEIIAEANDFYPHAANANTTAGRAGQTERPLRLAVVSYEQLLQQLKDRQARILDTLNQALAQQRIVQARISDWQQPSAEELEQPTHQGFVTLYAQRHIADLLCRPADRDTDFSVTSQIDALLQTLQVNRLSRPMMEPQFRQVHGDLAELARRELPEIEQQLSHFIQQSQRAEQDADPEQIGRKQSELAALGQLIAQVVETLERSHAALARWSTLEQIRHELASLELGQQQLLGACRNQLVGLAWNQEAAAGQSAASAWAAAVEGQRQLSHRFGSLMITMQGTAQQLAGEEPDSSRILEEVIAEARRQDLQIELHTAAEHLTKRRLGQAMSLEQQAAEHLEQLSAMLRQRKDTADSSNSSCTAASSKKGNQTPGAKPKEGKPGKDGQAGSQPASSTPKSQATAPPDEVPLDAVGQLVFDLWGQLPERERQQILQPLSEDFLPKYAPEIQQYFRALAEPPSGPERQGGNNAR